MRRELDEILQAHASMLGAKSHDVKHLFPDFRQSASIVEKSLKRSTFLTLGWKALPLVAYLHTRMTEAEKSKVDTMSEKAIIRMIAREDPQRIDVIFPDGEKTMTLTELREKVKYRLRLDIEELRAMDTLKDILAYWEKIRQEDKPWH